MADGSDEGLVRRIRRGDAAASEVLAARHLDRAIRIAVGITGRPDLADDAVQDAFERAFRRLASYDVTRPFAPWLYRIVVNCALDCVRSTPPTVELLDRDLVIPGPDPERLDLIAAVQRLDPDRRAVVMLRAVLGYSPPEIADALGVAVGTVHSRLSRAIDDLRQLMQEAAP